jgi:acetate kinase
LFDIITVVEVDQVLSFASNKEPTVHALEVILDWVKKTKVNLVAVGHRIVHGGDFGKALILNPDIRKKLSTLIPFSPLPQPYNLMGVKRMAKEFPNILHTASFDTAFHSTCNFLSQQYALPKSLTQMGLRRYGFVGLSYEYVASKLPLLLSEKEARSRIIVAHLGSGSTMCAMKNLKSVATSIGMTSMVGLPMATRCGDVDPYLGVYLIDQLGWSAKKVQALFYKESGLLGMSNLSGDMRLLLESDRSEAQLAIDLFVHRVSLFAGSLAAELQGIDGFVFTGGIGSKSLQIREKVCEKIAWLGLTLDKEKNRMGSLGPKRISSDTSSAFLYVLPTDEEIILAQHALSLYRETESLR